MKAATRALLLVALTLVVYLPAFRCGFIWDDDDHLTANPAMTSVHGLEQIWSSLAVSRYYPLTLTTFWIERHLWGLRMFPYHAVNVVLQCVNVTLLWALLRRLRVSGAWLAAALWAVHPVGVESVAWVTELKNIQSGFFFFLSILFFLRSEIDHRPGSYALALAFGAAAVLSKPSTVVLPLVLLLCVWWERGTIRRRDLFRVGPFFILAMAMSAMTIVEQQTMVLRAHTADWQLSAAERLIIAGKAIWFYAAHLLWPANLIFIYPRWNVSASSGTDWLPLAGIIALGVSLWALRRHGWARCALFGVGFFAVALLPVIGFFNVYFYYYSFVADHFQYLASIGLITLVATAGAAIYARCGVRGRSAAMFAATVLLVTLGTLTWQRVEAFQNLGTLWQDTLAKNPGAWMAHNNYGLFLFGAGRTSEAAAQYELALRLKPDYPEALNNLGTAFGEMGKYPEAIAQLQHALRVRPGYAEAHFNLGTVLVELQRPEEALAEYKLALQYKQDYPEAEHNLGVVLTQLGRIPEAIGCFEELLRMNPNDASAWHDLGLAMIQAGRFPEAVSRFEQALRIDPNYAEAHYDLGIALEQMGRSHEAISQYQRALEIRPDYREAQGRLKQLQAVR